jgi:hypothetical protein
VSKRLTNCQKWADPWFMELPPEMKLLWLYLCDSCDNSGVWIVNKKLVEILFGCFVDWSLAVNVLEGRVEVLAGGKKWWIQKFVNFQNPTGLDVTNAPQRQVAACLRSHGIDPSPFMKHQQKEGASRVDLVPYTMPCHTMQIPLSPKGSAEGEPQDAATEKETRRIENRKRLVKFLRGKRMAGADAAVEECLGLASDVGCKGIEETIDMLGWAIDQARSTRTDDIHWARNIEKEARMWAKQVKSA